MHWDGSQWSDSLGNAGDGSLNGIAATSANDVWVVGSIGKSRHTWAEHWDGTQWNYTELPSLRTCYFDSRNGLNDVAILSDGDIWAVGSMNDTYAGDREQGLFMHYSTCPNPVSTLVVHVEWQGRPIQPNLLQQLPITLTLQSDTTQVDYLALSTDATGIFAVPIGSVPEGLYTWRVKGPQYLAQTGTVLLTSAAVTNIDVGLMLTGDCNGDDVVAATDFSIFRRTFGKGLGDPGYDTRADFTGNNVVDVVDFNLLKSNFDLAGAPPITCE